MKKRNLKSLDMNQENNLMIMIDMNNKEGVETYVKRSSPKINNEKNSLGFLYACKTGRIEIAQILFDTIYPNSRCADGQTALMLVSQIEGDVKDKTIFMELLIERGCDVDLVDFCGKSALHWAVIRNCSWATRILIKRCNVNSTDLLGMTPLMYAAKFNFCSLMSLLLHTGADPAKCSKAQGSAIHLIVRHKSYDALNQIIPFCRHLNILNMCNQTPLDLAVLLNDTEMLRLLINSKKEIEINRRPSFAPFRTPLEEACFQNNFEIANILIIFGALVNYPLEFSFELRKGNCCSKPVAPIMFAISNKNVKLVELLIKNGADIDIWCTKAPGHTIMMTPLALAAEIGNMEIIDLLEKHKIFSDERIIGESFSSACSAHNIDVVSYFLEKYKIYPSQYKLHNGLPVILELFKDCMNNSKMDKILDINEELIGDIFTPEIAQSLSRRNFGSSMQLYREAWLKLAIKFRNGLLEISKSDEMFYLNFIISFLEYFFLKKKIEDLELIQHKLNELRIFPYRLIRYAVHSSRLIKSILLSRSIYALIFLIELHLDEKLIFWDKKSEQLLDLCEFALFFDNIEAALILNLTCGISLNCIIEYETFPYIPEILNPSIEYNEIDKINSLKYLSRNVKSLKTLCKYAIRRFVDSELLLIRLSELSQQILDDLYLDLSACISYSETSENSIIRYSKLCRWAGLDSNELDFNNF